MPLRKLTTKQTEQNNQNMINSILSSIKYYEALSPYYNKAKIDQLKEKLKQLQSGQTITSYQV